MRIAQACPKCRSTDIVRIPGVLGPYGAGNIAVGRTIFSGVKLTRYLCAACGFSEEWVDSPDDTAKIKKKYSS